MMPLIYGLSFAAVYHVGGFSLLAIVVFTVYAIKFGLWGKK